jgi:hypothetical protein
MTLVWGVMDNPSDIKEIAASACRTAREEDFAKPGDIIAITAARRSASPATQIC